MSNSIPLSQMSRPQGLGWLYVDFNSYFASVEQELNPALRGRPVAVVPVETDATCAIAASYEAKAFGIRTGTPIYEAKKMCPDLVCVLAQHEHYVDFHDRILDEIDRHIPVTKVASIDEMACQLMRNETAPARACEIALAIKKSLAENIGAHVRCSIGIAPSRYLAKVATDLHKPDGLTVLMPDELPHRLLSLSLRDLPGIGANVEKRLNDAGVFDMKGLLAVEPKHMRAIWGNLWGEKMWYYLRGYDLPDPESERNSVGHSHVLAPDMRPMARAHLIARRLTMKASARLRRMGYHATRFSLSVRMENGPRLGLEAACEASHDSFTFLQMAERIWRQLAAEAGPRPRVKKVSVVLGGLVADSQVGRQGDLFAAAAPQADKARNEKISKAIDDLNQKFGKDTVLIGMTGQQGKSFTGTKIAFTRIPDREEFLE